MRSTLTAACRRTPPSVSLWLAALLFAGQSGAAGLQVTPISLDFGALQRAQGVWLSNTGRTPLRAQLRLKAWKQADGAETLEDTGDLMASPPFVELPPGERQLVRLVRPQPSAPAVETAYRLLVDELPADESTGEAVASPSATPRNGLRLLFRYSIPVFVGVSEKTAESPLTTDRSAALAAVVGQLAPEPSVAPDAMTLTVRNGGRQRVKLSEVVHVDGSGSRTPLAPGLLGYVLPGAAMQWRLRVPSSMHRIDGVIKARFNDDMDEQILPPGRLDR